MMKRIASLISVLVICILLLPVNCFEANAEMLTGYPAESALIDELGLYNDDKQTFEELDSMIKSTADDVGFNLVVFIAGTKRSDRETEIFADDSYDEIFGEDTDGIFYYMDLSGVSPACDWISTSGETVLVYEQYTDSIFTTLDNYLPASGEPIYTENITAAIKQYLECIRKHSDEKPSAWDYHYDPDTDTYAYYKNGEYTVTDKKPMVLYIKAFLPSLVIGFLTALIVYAVTKSNYKFKSSTNPKAYVAENLSGFRVSQDIYIRTETKKVRVNTDSGGSGHRSGGGHSHSGHHGGGGHHR